MKQKDYIFIGGVTLGIFLITYTVLALIGFVPEQLKFVSKEPVAKAIVQEDVALAKKNTNTSEPLAVDTNLIPNHISIPKIGVDSSIVIPQGVDVAVLDNALTKGAVYYPGSGTLQGGNMFLFGHSTNWKVVNNEAYRTFNDLDKLVIGDEIELKSGDKTYTYAVRTVKRASENDALVNFASSGQSLTISTCDTFGRKQDRWVVEADLTRVS